eukprot:scaffold2889_cov407-Prasinococcus_capsulatus_cf.AAC.1
MPVVESLTLATLRNWRMAKPMPIKPHTMMKRLVPIAASPMVLWAQLLRTRPSVAGSRYWWEGGRKIDLVTAHGPAYERVRVQLETVPPVATATNKSALSHRGRGARDRVILVQCGVRRRVVHSLSAAGMAHRAQQAAPPASARSPDCQR